jgi:hypothetical protein
VFSLADTLSTTGHAKLHFPTGAVGNYYYIAIKHRNSIETWSSDTIQMNTNTNYDFSSGAGQAYGNNVIDDGTGIFLLYGGDVDQSGTIDSGDYPEVDLGSFNGFNGYILSDVDGSGTIDSGDYPILDLNSFLGISSNHP